MTPDTAGSAGQDRITDSGRELALVSLGLHGRVADAADPADRRDALPARGGHRCRLTRPQLTRRWCPSATSATTTVTTTVCGPDANVGATVADDPTTTAALDVSSLRVIECDAEPRHPELFYVHNEDDWYPPPCYLCILHDDDVRRDKERHARHRAWHRWRIVQWLMTQAYCSGLALTGGGHGWGGYGGCNGCVTSWPRFARGERYYVLWWERWKWTCLRRGHWPGEYVGLGACGKCLPCPDCGSTTAGHNEGCSW